MGGRAAPDSELFSHRFAPGPGAVGKIDRGVVPRRAETAGLVDDFGDHSLGWGLSTEEAVAGSPCLP